LKAQRSAQFRELHHLLRKIREIGRVSGDSLDLQ
jgi:hypothetical protein